MTFTEVIVPKFTRAELRLPVTKWTLIQSELEEENENLKLGMTRMKKTISECDREIDELLDLIQFLTNENRILKVLPAGFSSPSRYHVDDEKSF